MKKILLIVLFVFALTSCFGDSEDVKKAKQELGVIEKEIIVGNESDTINGEDLGELIDGDLRIQVNQISGERILELDELEYMDFKSGHAQITGRTLGKVESIQVDFTNSDSDFPDDSFVLKKFKPGDVTFEYNANARFKVLDFGTNVYTFSATVGDDISVLELKVLVSENDDQVLEGKGNVDMSFDKEEKEESEVSELIGGEQDFVFTDLPTGGDYGDVLRLGESSFTYTDIKGLEINKEKLGAITCDKDEETDKYYVTSLLAESQKSWYYWNTCRDIVKGKGISFFVTRLDGEKYVYEKHFLDTNHGLYGIYELESGAGANKDNLADTNKILKEKNGEYGQLEIVDSLFRKIVK